MIEYKYENEGTQEFDVRDANFVLKDIVLPRTPSKIKIKSFVPLPNIMKDPFLYHPNVVNGLQKLRLSFCAIERIPPEISKLINLQVLNLSYNNIKVIDKNTITTLNLYGLDLRGNLIEDLDVFKDQPMESIFWVDLGDNKIKKIPEWIDKSFPNIMDLHIINNKITELPDSLKNLKKLETFFWSGNGGLLDYISPTEGIRHNKVKNYVKSKVRDDFPEFSDMAKSNQMQFYLAFPTAPSHSPIFINKKFKNYDPIEMENKEYTISKYLDEDPDNIVIVYKNKRENTYQRFLSSCETFKTFYNNPSMILYPCKKEDTMRSENIHDKKVFNINSIGLINSFKYALIHKATVNRILHGKGNRLEEIDNNYKAVRDMPNVFLIEGTGVRFPSFVSQAVLDGGNRVGAMHCQKGHESEVGIMTFLGLESMRKMVKVMKNKNKRKIEARPEMNSSSGSSGSTGSSSKKRKRGGKRRKSRKRRKNRKKKKKSRKKKIKKKKSRKKK
jgi:hypothetical protein